MKKARPSPSPAQHKEQEHVMVQKLAREHGDYETRLRELEAKGYQTEEEQQEMRILKKKKLLCKDRIEQIRRSL